MGQVTLDLGALFGSGGQPTGDPNQPFKYNFWDRLSGRQNPNQEYMVRKMLEDQNNNAVLEREKTIEGLRNQNQLKTIQTQKEAEYQNWLKQQNYVPDTSTTEGQAAYHQKIAEAQARGQEKGRIDVRNEDIAKDANYTKNPNLYLSNPRYLEVAKDKLGLDDNASVMDVTKAVENMSPSQLAEYNTYLGTEASNRATAGGKLKSDLAAAKAKADQGVELIPQNSKIGVAKANAELGINPEDSAPLSGQRAKALGSSLGLSSADDDAKTQFAGQRAALQNTLLQNSVSASNYDPLLGGVLNLGSGTLYQNKPAQRLLDPAKPFDPVKNPKINDPMGGNIISGSQFAQPRQGYGMQSTTPMARTSPLGSSSTLKSVGTFPMSAEGINPPSASPEASAQFMPGAAHPIDTNLIRQLLQQAQTRLNDPNAINVSKGVGDWTSGNADTDQFSGSDNSVNGILRKLLQQ